MRLTSTTASQVLSTAMDGFSVLVEHESNALDNQLDGLRERLVVARRARSLGELLRNQLDLLPDTQARLKRDHAVREALIEGLRRDLWRDFSQRSAA